ncbi:MAG: ferrous iron transport protein B, partial [Candidatus Marinimicrobia bacterium]|nr:ferrous iron transport protein B [Candidatus Neomarinimicrobiota bacterium]
MKNSGLNIAIAGNPNSGKTTIFNAITGARQRVGNWPGVTVERKTGYINRGENRWNFIDLPGTYSLSAFSQEEIIARNYITDEQPDVVVNIVDASNIERNLYLTTQLIELGCPLVIVLNMMDIAKEKGVEIDIETLSTLLGAPIVPVVGSTGEGVEHILDKIDRVVTHESQKSRKLQINYHRDIEAKIEEIIREIDEVDVSNNHRWTAIKLLENDSEILKRVNIGEQIQNKVKSLRQNIENLFKDNTQAIFSNARYGFIQGAVKECVTIHKIDRVDVSKKIDSVLTNKYLGLPIFALLMWLTFKFTFDVGQYPMAWIDGLVSALGAFLSYILPNGTLLQSLVVDGIVAGVGGIAIFLPNIFILFFVIAILEDSGYMARVAFI